MSERGSRVDLSYIQRDDLIYLAGLIDGDGCFFISKRTKATTNGYASYMMKLQVHCIAESLIDWVHSTFGGVKIAHHTKGKAGRNPLYGVEFTGNRLTCMCELLIPFLKLKKPNAENMLEMRRLYNGLGGRITVPQHIQDARDRCFTRSRQLNTHKPIKVLAPCLPTAMPLGVPSQLE